MAPIDPAKIRLAHGKGLASARRLAKEWDEAAVSLPNVSGIELRAQREAIITEMARTVTPSVDELEQLYELPDDRD